MSPGLVVEVLGKSQAEFEVARDNLTDFPGHGENLETVQDAVETGLVSSFLQFFFCLCACVSFFCFCFALVMEASRKKSGDT